MEIQTFFCEDEDSENAKKNIIEKVKIFVSLDIDIFWINYQTETRSEQFVAMAEICYAKMKR